MVGGHPSFHGGGAGQMSRSAAWRNSMVGGFSSFRGAPSIAPSMMGSGLAPGSFTGGGSSAPSVHTGFNSSRGTRYNEFDDLRSVSSAGTRRTHAETLASLPVNHILPWLYGKIERETAEEIMQPRTDGLYLIRESNRFPGDYTLCVCFNEEMYQYRIKAVGPKVTIDDEVLFDDIQSLVLHYHRSSDGLVTALAKPVTVPKDSTLARNSASSPLWSAPDRDQEWTTVRNALMGPDMSPGEYLDVRGGSVH